MQIDTYTVGVRFEIDNNSFRNIQRQLERLAEQARRIRLDLDEGGGGGGGDRGRRNDARVGGFGMIGRFAGPVAGVLSLKEGIQAAADLDKAMVGVQKTTGLADDEAQQLKENLIEASTIDTSTAPERLLAFAQAMGSMGMTSREEIEAAAIAMGKLEAASDIQGDFGALQIGKMLGLLGLANTQFEQLASQFVRMGNDFKTTESQVLSVANEVAKVGQIFSLQAPEVIGLSTAFSELAITPENARTAILKLMTTLQNAVAGNTAQMAQLRKETSLTNEEITQMAWGTREQKLALEDLTGRKIRRIREEITAGQDEMAALISVTGQSGEAIRQAFSEDRLGLFLSVTERLSEMNQAGENLTLTYKDLGVNEVALSTSLNTLGGNVERVKEILKTANDEWKISNDQMTALNKEAEAAGKSFSAAFDKMVNALKGLADAIASTGILEFLGKIINMATQAIKVTVDLVRNIKEISKEAIDFIPEPVKEVAEIYKNVEAKDFVPPQVRGFYEGVRGFLSDDDKVSIPEDKLPTPPKSPDFVGPIRPDNIRNTQNINATINQSITGSGEPDAIKRATEEGLAEVANVMETASGGF